MTELLGTLIKDLSDWGPTLLRGAFATVVLTGLSGAVATAGGLLLAIIRTRRVPILNQVAIVYIDVIRSIPVLVSLFIIYFGLAQLGLALPSLVAAVLGLGLIGCAYMAENFRAGLIAVPRGQREAAASLGLTTRQSLTHVILPQAVRVSVPASINYAIGLLKDTAIAATVAAPELLFAGKSLVSLTARPLEVYFLVAVMYLMLSLPLAYAGRYAERQLSTGRQT